jgi:hypothetical protein
LPVARLKHFILYLPGSLLINPLLSDSKPTFILYGQIAVLRFSWSQSLGFVSIRVRKILDRKGKGKENRRAPAESARKPGQVIDLMQALKQSLGAGAAEKKGTKRQVRYGDKEMK